MAITSLSAKKPAGGLSLFSDFFELWNDWFWDGVGGKAVTIPKVNISEDKSSYSLQVAAPGLHKSDFKIDVHGNILTISAEREEKKEEKEEKFSRKEYNYSSFSRSFTLPETVLQDKIEAT
jgi:HSP20 family protein